MKKTWYALCVAVFVAGVVTFAQTQRSDTEPARSYTVVTEHFRLNADGSRTNLGARIVYARADGELRQSPYDANNPQSSNSHPALARTAEGVFATASGAAERKMVSSTPIPPEMQACFRSVTCLKSRQNYVRTDELAGLQVYVLHDEIPAPNPMEWIETSYSPKIGFLALRTIRHMRDGSEDVLQATSVEFKEVPEDLNQDIKAMPIKHP